MEKITKRELLFFTIVALLAVNMSLAQVTTSPGATGTVSYPTNVAITGGSINGTPIGASTPASGAFTSGSFVNSITVGTATTDGVITGTRLNNTLDAGVTSISLKRGAGTGTFASVTVVGDGADGAKGIGLGLGSGGVSLFKATTTEGSSVIGPFQVSTGGSTGKATCWKADGKTIGYCSTVIDAGGGCTCN